MIHFIHLLKNPKVINLAPVYLKFTSLIRWGGFSGIDLLFDDDHYHQLIKPIICNELFSS